MKKWDYADESTLAFNIALIIVGILFTGVAVAMYQDFPVLSLVILITLALFFLPFYLVIHSKRRKRMRIVKYCDYKTYGKVVGSECQELEIPLADSAATTSSYSRHMVVEYRDASNVWHRFTTPAVNTHLRNYTLIDGLMCDVYIKGDEVLARNFREDTIFSKPILEELEERKRRKNLIKKYRVKACLWVVAMLLWIGLSIPLYTIIPINDVSVIIIIVGILVFSALYSDCHTEIRRITSGDYKKRTK